VTRVRYRITHASRYAYDDAVAVSYNEARLTPMRLSWQTPLETALLIEPGTWQHHYQDYWGTEVCVFEATTAHRTLDVHATSLVEVDASLRPAPTVDDWAAVRDPAVADRWCEYLASTPLTAVPRELADRAARIASRSRPGDAAREISRCVHDALTYEPGSTQVHTSAAEAWRDKRGVCQDYAHLVVGALRHVGLPARYVSGYLHPAAEPAVGQTHRGESHAWVEWWQGEWVAFDPTNAAEVGSRHVMVGAGRDYADVPPIKGIVAGELSTADLEIAVELTRLA